MKRSFLLLLLSFFLSTSYTLAQYEVTVEAYVLDKITGQPLPYVNIGFVDKAVGTVSDENGKFTLVYHEDYIGGKDILQISTLGYKTIKVSASKLVKFLTNTNKFYMEPQPFTLDEVFITDDTREEITIGNAKPTTASLGYWKDKDALGGEIAALIDIKKKNTRLHQLTFNIVENTADSLKVRVHVYDYKRRYPGDKLQSRNVFHTIKKKEGLETIDLKPYNIKVNDDVVIAIELIEVYGDAINFAISATDYTGKSFSRHISQDKWRRYLNIGINFEVLASIPVSEDKIVSVERDKPERITLYYDISQNLKYRDTDKEFNVLSAYLKTLKDVDVEVIKFSSSRMTPRVFNITNGKSKELIAYLEDSHYEGASDFKNILKTNAFNADVVLLFSDGNAGFYPLEQEVNLPAFCINSVPDADHYALQRTSFYADGHYINLRKASEKIALDYMLNEVDDRNIYNEDSVNLSKGDVKGRIFTASGPIQGATIRVKNTFIEAQSDVDGEFDIDAAEGDILVANFIGMNEKQVQVPPTRKVGILMTPDGELLDEVVLKGQKKNEEDDLDTGYGRKDEDAIGYAINTITADEISPSANTLADVIIGRFAGVQVAGHNVAYNTPKFIIRSGGGSLNIAYAMFDIDGIVYDSGQPIPFINVQNIERITILKSTSATNRYGTIGRGGAIIIKTKSLNGAGSTEELSSALVKGNDYEEDSVQLIGSLASTPNYIVELNKAASYEEALTIYREQKQHLNQTIPYVLDVSEYFMKWDTEFAHTVLSNIASIAGKNPKALKTLAYRLDELEKYEQSKFIYERILLLRPDDAQSYRDMALSYQHIGAYQEAMKLYKLILSNSIEGVDFTGMQKTIGNDMMHLLAFHRSKVNYKDLPTDYLSADFKIDLRIVFEWNDPSAEFEIQFVNPRKKYYKWSHTKFENRKRLLDEITNGYNTEEYVIDDADPGEWIINIECLSEEPLLNPTYLKYTVYKNYGLSNESKEVKVIKLYQQKQKVTLDKFLYQ